MDKATLVFEVDSMLGLLDTELRSFVALAQAGLYRKAAHSQYYAAYDACCALLLTRGIKVERHEAAQSLISLHFVKSGALPRETSGRLNLLMGQRHAADYHGAIEIGYDEVAANHAWVIGFVNDALRLIEQSGMAAKAGVATARKAAKLAASLPPPGSRRATSPRT